MIMQKLVLAPGETIQRRKIHEALGGQTQSGISPAPSSKAVFIFSDPTSGERYGYHDGWHSDGFFHYCGEGQRGDQVFKRGNKAILNHRADNQLLYVFKGNGKGKPVTYVGEFALHDYYESDAVDVDGGPMRRVIMFRLAPIEALPNQRIREEIPQVDAQIAEVEIENQHTERTIFNPKVEPVETERRESALVQAYKSYRLRNGVSLKRQRIKPAGESKPLFTDLFDSSDNLLVEAKGSVSRECIRMAIGQLLDYSRFFTPRPRLGILLPCKPRKDLLDLIFSQEMLLVYQDGEHFITLKG